MPAFLLSFLGGIPQLIGGIFNGLKTGAQFVMGAVQTLAKGFMSLANLVGGVVIGGLKLFMTALITATQNSMAYAKSVNDLRLGSGMSMKQAAATSMRYGAFGISPQALAQARGGQHESMYQLGGRIRGVDVNDPGSIARKYQSFSNDAVGHAMREDMLESTGMNTDKGRWMASLSPEKIQEQENFTQKIGQSLGVSPETMSRMAEDLPLAQAKLETFLQMVQLKFVEGALPIMEKAIGWLSDFIGERAPDIANVFASTFEWIFVEGPNVILNGARTIIDVFQWLSDSFFTVAGTVIEFLRTLESSNSGLGGFVVTFLSVIDFVINAFHTIGDIWHNFIATIANVLLLQLRNMVSAFDLLVPKPLQEKMGLDPEKVDRLKKVEFEEWRFGDTANDSNLAGKFQAYQKSGEIGKFADAAEQRLANAKKTADSGLSTLNTAYDAAKASAGTTDSRREQHGEMMGALQGISKTNEEIAGNTKPKVETNNGDVGVQGWLARFANDRARQRFLQETR